MKDGQRLIVKRIKSEEDLPKEGIFWVHQKVYEDIILNKFDFNTPHRKLWTSDIDWYLIPEPKQEIKSGYAENYLNECIKKAEPNLSKIKDVDKELAEIRNSKTVLDYPSDFDTIATNQVSPFKNDITDSDIEAWAEKEFGDSMIIPEQAAIAGAKAVLNGEIKHNG
jgi:hypothetical protein